MDTPSPPSKAIFKNPYLYSSVCFVAVLAYLAFLFASRRETTREFDRREEEKTAEQRRANDRAAVEQLGGSELAVRALYLSPPLIHHGESAQLCYDVVNAKSVVLDPSAGEVWPSHNRCLTVAPKQTTTYTLTITDAAGKSARESAQLEVR